MEVENHLFDSGKWSSKGTILHFHVSSRECNHSSTGSHLIPNSPTKKVLQVIHFSWVSLSFASSMSIRLLGVSLQGRRDVLFHHLFEELEPQVVQSMF